MSGKYRSEAMAAIHETMQAIHDVGAIDKQTMRRFDGACLACAEMRQMPVGQTAITTTPKS